MNVWIVKTSSTILGVFRDESEAEALSDHVNGTCASASVECHDVWIVHPASLPHPPVLDPCAAHPVPIRNLDGYILAWTGTPEARAEIERWREPQPATLPRPIDTPVPEHPVACVVSRESGKVVVWAISHYGAQLIADAWCKVEGHGAYRYEKL